MHSFDLCGRWIYLSCGFACLVGLKKKLDLLPGNARCDLYQKITAGSSRTSSGEGCDSFRVGVQAFIAGPENNADWMY